MSKTVVIEPDMPIREGSTFHVFSRHLAVGDEVEIKRGYKRLIGKAIAKGSVVANGSADPRASVPHKHNGNARAWKQYWKVQVRKVL